MRLWVTWDGGNKSYVIAPAPNQEQPDFDLWQHHERIRKFCSRILGKKFIQLTKSGDMDTLFLDVKNGTASAPDSKYEFSALKGWIGVFLLEE